MKKMFEEYKEMKKNDPNKLVAFCMGDLLGFFGEDAWYVEKMLVNAPKEHKDLYQTEEDCPRYEWKETDGVRCLSAELDAMELFVVLGGGITIIPNNI